jgi:protein-disulfide isomerase
MRIAVLGVALFAVACSATSAQPAKSAAPADVVATVGSTAITMAQVDEKALQQSAASFGQMRLSQALYEARRMALDVMVGDTLIDGEAKARGVERSALIEKEIAAKVAPVGDAEVASWYQANQGRVQGAPLDQVRAPIRAYLIQERMADARERFVESLKAKTKVTLALPPPRQTVASTGAARGQANAPIEMIEFSDFQCPFCQRAHETVDKVLSTYGDRIHFVYRHYPVQGHPNAQQAAEASECANEQGQFWPYHDRLFANPRKLGDADLKEHAAALNLDTAKFNACVDGHKYQERVLGDMRDGEAVGVNGTPAFFINGRMLSGAQPFDAFKKIIDEELALKATR